MGPRQQLLTAVYEAFNRRDIDSVLSLMRPDVDWPNGMEGGRVDGSDDVRGYRKRQRGRIDPPVEPPHMEEDQAGNSVGDVHQVLRGLSGKILKGQIVQHVDSFRDG